MSFVAEDLSTTYHERYQWCTAYLNGLFDLKTNPERYNTWSVWAEHIKLLLDTGLRDERAKARFERRTDRLAEAMAKTMMGDLEFYLPRHVQISAGTRPLSDELHALTVHYIATRLLTRVDSADFASFVCEKENRK